MPELRYYQRAAVNAVHRHLKSFKTNPVVVIPTGGGKSYVLSQLIKDVSEVGGRSLVLAHVKELLLQNHSHASNLGLLDVGLYSSGLKRRDTDNQVIVAGIQSIYKKPEILGKFKLIIIDEAHLVPDAGWGMYRTFLSAHPEARLVGLTATPYRMSTGPICKPDNLLQEICYEIGVKELMAKGYICKLISKAPDHLLDTTGLHIERGEFKSDEVRSLVNPIDNVRKAVKEIKKANRKSNLIFCANVDHAEKVAKEIGGEVVLGDTIHRDRILERFKRGDLRYLVNVGVLTTGFDAPNIDCVALLRPTASPGLFYQMCGRGFRISEQKDDCLVLDFGNNVARHGPVDCIDAPPRPRRDGKGPGRARLCPGCRCLIAVSYRKCPECGHVFPKGPPKHDGTSSDAPIISGTPRYNEYEVQEVSYAEHQKKGTEPGERPTTLRVTYKLGINYLKSEWLCFNHPEGSWAREKAEEWWAERSDQPAPATVKEAVEMAEAGFVKEAKKVTIKETPGVKYPEEIFDVVIGDYPKEPGSEEPEDDWRDHVYVPPDKDVPF